MLSTVRFYAFTDMLPVPTYVLGGGPVVGLPHFLCNSLGPQWQYWCVLAVARATYSREPTPVVAAPPTGQARSHTPVRGATTMWW